MSLPDPDVLAPPAPSGRWRALALLAVAELLGMSLWFSASASVPAIQAEWRLSDSAAAWLTLAVQLGFVWGTLMSALSNLPDVVNTRRLFAASALLAALSNAAFSIFAKGPGLGIPLRFATGFFLAGVYPPGMKIMATWFRRGRGLALGFLVGALTLGKASPYLVNAIAGSGWRGHVLFVSLLAVFGGSLVLFFVADGPYSTGNAPFNIRQAGEVFRNRGVRLANFGYFGHMWELYAMWTWAPVFIRASFAASDSSPVLAEAGSFLVLGAGAAGCVAAGYLADRIGRTIVASTALAISGTCCVVVGYLFGAGPFLLLAIMAIWGASVVADSAQFSACVTELGDPRYLGTALTLQVCLGFLLTTFSIRMMPALVKAVTWKYAFAFLAPGPVFGVLAMMRLRSLPEAVKIAQGRR
ncbi:MAG TPA: MFS transporter [Thermoanaerobaculia bacterium]|nr:MFS transporter [Thermoanaerobaculia bacterium]